MKLLDEAAVIAELDALLGYDENHPDIDRAIEAIRALPAAPLPALTDEMVDYNAASLEWMRQMDAFVAALERASNGEKDEMFRGDVKLIIDAALRRA